MNKELFTYDVLYRRCSAISRRKVFLYFTKFNLVDTFTYHCHITFTLTYHLTLKTSHLLNYIKHFANTLLFFDIQGVSRYLRQFPKYLTVEISKKKELVKNELHAIYTAKRIYDVDVVHAHARES